jgi:CheY-like chemotaxis protein
LILLDINMPRMNGLELLTSLREDPKLSSCVVFILTTSQDVEDKLAAYALNVAGYIHKKRVDEGFMKVVDMLDHYWRIVELPAV